MQILNLSGCYISSLSPFSLFDRSFNTSLISINLSNNKITSIKPFYNVAWYGALQPLELDISDNKIGDSGMKYISAYIGYKEVDSN